jgi:tRNA (guanine-N7-)-methyltransferase
MSRRLRHHVNPLNLSYLATGRPLPELARAGTMEVELGCADARFLFDLARRDPETHYVGVEIREPLVKWVNRTAHAEGLANLQAVFANINVDLDALVSDERLRRVYVNFPDPWFKRRHQKRRVMNVDLVEVLQRKLEPGGELFFQSDIFDLALDAMAALEAEPRRFDNLAGPWTFVRENPFPAKSLREVRCEEREKRIWRMRYVRR